MMALTHIGEKMLTVGGVPAEIEKNSSESSCHLIFYKRNFDAVYYAINADEHRILRIMIGLLPASWLAKILIEIFEEHIRIPWLSAFLMKTLNGLRSSDLLVGIFEDI